MRNHTEFPLFRSPLTSALLFVHCVLISTFQPAKVFEPEISNPFAVSENIRGEEGAGESEDTLLPPGLKLDNEYSIRENLDQNVLKVRGTFKGASLELMQHRSFKII